MEQAMQMANLLRYYSLQPGSSTNMFTMPLTQNAFPSLQMGSEYLNALSMFPFQPTPQFGNGTMQQFGAVQQPALGAYGNDEANRGLLDELCIAQLLANLPMQSQQPNLDIRGENAENPGVGLQAFVAQHLPGGEKRSHENMISMASPCFSSSSSSGSSGLSSTMITPFVSQSEVSASANSMKKDSLEGRKSVLDPKLCDLEEQSKRRKVEASSSCDSPTRSNSPAQSMPSPKDNLQKNLKEKDRRTETRKLYAELKKSICLIKEVKTDVCLNRTEILQQLISCLEVDLNLPFPSTELQLEALRAKYDELIGKHQAMEGERQSFRSVLHNPQEEPAKKAIIEIAKEQDHKMIRKIKENYRRDILGFLILLTGMFFNNEKVDSNLSVLKTANMALSKHIAQKLRKVSKQI